VLKQLRKDECFDLDCYSWLISDCIHNSLLLQTTNMLLECGELALRSPTDTIPNLKPLRWEDKQNQQQEE
jgi:aspartate kinase